MGWLAAPLCTMNCTHVYCIYVNIYTCTIYPVIYGSLLALHIAIVHMCIISVVNVGWWLPGRSTTKWQWTRLWLVIASGIRTLHWSKIYSIQGCQFLSQSPIYAQNHLHGRLICWLVDYLQFVITLYWSKINSIQGSQFLSNPGVRSMSIRH